MGVTAWSQGWRAANCTQDWPHTPAGRPSPPHTYGDNLKSSIVVRGVKNVLSVLIPNTQYEEHHSKETNSKDQSRHTLPQKSVSPVKSSVITNNLFPVNRKSYLSKVELSEKKLDCVDIVDEKNMKERKRRE